MNLKQLVRRLINIIPAVVGHLIPRTGVENIESDIRVEMPVQTGSTGATHGHIANVILALAQTVLPSWMNKYGVHIF